MRLRGAQDSSDSSCTTRRGLFSAPPRMAACITGKHSPEQRQPTCTLQRFIERSANDLADFPASWQPHKLMEGPEWRRIEEVFYEAIDLALGDRAAFLDRVCASDRELRRQVESLLASDNSKDGLLHAAIAN